MTDVLVLIAWAVFAAVWITGALRTARTVRKNPLAARLAHRLPLGLGIVCMMVAIHGYSKVGTLPWWIGVVVLYGGIFIAIWARFVLGRVWSGEVTLKEGHRLVQSGPYAVVRNPIYTGLLAALLGMAVLSWQWLAGVGVAFVALGFIVKIRQEEGFMRDAFGDEYEAYAKQVRRLLPFVW